MRRKAGISGIQQSEALRQRFEDKKREIQSQQIKELTAQLEKFKDLLKDFTQKHSHKFKDLQFRNYFSQICAKIGVDPLYSQNTIFTRLFGFNTDLC